MKTLVLGLGNPILSDDGVGLRVAEELRAKLDLPDVTVEETSMSGLNLLDILVGYDRAIIVDAIQTKGGKPGQIYRLDSKALDNTQHITSLHDVNFADTLELGSRIGLPLPKQIDIFAIEVADVSTFGEECTPELERAIPVCVETIIQELKGDCDA